MHFPENCHNNNCKNIAEKLIRYGNFVITNIWLAFLFLELSGKKNCCKNKTRSACVHRIKWRHLLNNKHAAAVLHSENSFYNKFSLFVRGKKALPLFYSCASLHILHLGWYQPESSFLCWNIDEIIVKFIKEGRLFLFWKWENENKGENELFFFLCTYSDCVVCI